LQHYPFNEPISLIEIERWPSIDGFETDRGLGVEHQKRLNKQRNELEMLWLKLKRPNLKLLQPILAPMMLRLEQEMPMRDLSLNKLDIMLSRSS